MTTRLQYLQAEQTLLAKQRYDLESLITELRKELNELCEQQQKLCVEETEIIIANM